MLQAVNRSSLLLGPPLAGVLISLMGPVPVLWIDVATFAVSFALVSAFVHIFRSSGLQILKTPPQAPRANAVCERLIGTLRRELLDQVLTLNEHHLRQILTEYAGHFNDHRPHQSRDQRPPNAETAATQPIADLADLRSVRRQLIISGLIHQYHRAA